MTHISRDLRLTAAWGALLCFAMIGCANSAPTGEVEGVVTLNGKPLDEVQVTFMPDPAQNTVGATASAVTDSQGKFKLYPATGSASGVAVGHHRVTLRDLKNYQPPAGRGGGRGPADGAAAPAPKRVPAIYEDPRSTPLTREVTPGQQTINFEVTPDGGKK